MLKKKITDLTIHNSSAQKLIITEHMSRYCGGGKIIDHLRSAEKK